jgi:hypothetical protein
LDIEREYESIHRIDYTFGANFMEYHSGYGRKYYTIWKALIATSPKFEDQQTYSNPWEMIDYVQSTFDLFQEFANEVNMNHLYVFMEGMAEGYLSKEISKDEFGNNESEMLAMVKSKGTPLFVYKEDEISNLDLEKIGEEIRPILKINV